MDARLARVVTMPWGAVVTDPRFPLIHDVNCARVDRGHGLDLSAVREVLVSALHAAGAPALHVVTFDPAGSERLLDDLERAGAAFTYDTVMKWHAASPEPRRRHEVAELDPNG